MTRIVELIKRYPVFYEFARHTVYSRIQSARRRRIFNEAFRTNLWDGASASGIGSSLEATQPLRDALPDTFRKLGVRSLLDIPCGDLHWVSSLSLGDIRYTGADIVEVLIEQNRQRYTNFGEFLVLDLLQDKLPKHDLIFCRDCFGHLSLRDARRALDNILRAQPRYIMATTFPACPHNADTVVPYWRRINLCLPPFNLPPPLEYLADHRPGDKNNDGKFIGIWKMPFEA